MKVYTITEAALRQVLTKAVHDTITAKQPVTFDVIETYVKDVVNASKQTCQYDEEGEGYTAPACLAANYHVEGCQYFE